MCLTADPGVASLSLAPYFHGDDQKIILTANHLPSSDSRRVVSYKRKYVHYVLANSLVKLGQEKSVVR